MTGPRHLGPTQGTGVELGSAPCHPHGLPEEEGFSAGKLTSYVQQQEAWASEGRTTQSGAGHGGRTRQGNDEAASRAPRPAQGHPKVPGALHGLQRPPRCQPGSPTALQGPGVPTRPWNS